MIFTAYICNFVIDNSKLKYSLRFFVNNLIEKQKKYVSASLNNGFYHNTKTVQLF